MTGALLQSSHNINITNNFMSEYFAKALILHRFEHNLEV